MEGVAGGGAAGKEVQQERDAGVAEKGGGGGAGELREIEAGEGDEAAAVGEGGEHDRLEEDGEIRGPGEARDAEALVEEPVDGQGEDE